MERQELSNLDPPRPKDWEGVRLNRETRRVVHLIRNDDEALDIARRLSADFAATASARDRQGVWRLTKSTRSAPQRRAEAISRNDEWERSERLMERIRSK
jgi:hypothetical protein